MIGYSMFLSVLMFLVTVLGPQAAIAQKTDPSIVDFKVQALYRAAKLTWKAKDGLKDPLIGADCKIRNLRGRSL